MDLIASEHIWVAHRESGMDSGSISVILGSALHCQMHYLEILQIFSHPLRPSSKNQANELESFPDPSVSTTRRIHLITQVGFQLTKNWTSDNYGFNVVCIWVDLELICVDTTSCSGSEVYLGDMAKIWNGCKWMWGESDGAVMDLGEWNRVHSNRFRS